MEVGLNGPVIQLNRYKAIAPMITRSWMKHTWADCAANNLTICDSIPDFPMRMENDRLLTSLFLEYGYSGKILCALKQC